MIRSPLVLEQNNGLMMFWRADQGVQGIQGIQGIHVTRQLLVGKNPGD